MQKEKRDSPTPIRFPLDLKDDIKKMAEKQNRSFSNWVITACIEKIKNKKA